MPFVDTDRAPLRSIELGQVPITAPTFQLRSRIGYYEPRAGGVPGESEITWARAHEPSARPSRAERTDLASVPAVFWSLIASYGRQTAPAVLHDGESWRIRAEVADGTLAQPAALAQRERVDRLFRLGLRELGVAPLRAWIMWTVVSFERHWWHARARFFALIVLAGVGIGSIVAASIGVAAGSPGWAVLALAPLVTSAVGGRRWRLLIWASYLGALLLPIVILQVAAFLPFLLLENAAWFVVDWLPHRRGSPVLGPMDVRNLRRVG